MKAYGLWFQTEGRVQFERLVKVFEYSFKKHNPDVELIIEKSEYPSPRYGLKPAHLENVFKLERWNDIIQSSEEPVLLLDTDLLILDCLNDITKKKDDIIITNRHYSTIKYNAGVILVNPSLGSKRFFQQWRDTSSIDFKSTDEYWRGILNTAKGATQSTLTELLCNQAFCSVGYLSCAVWNSAVTDWPRFSDETKILHIKGNLRKYILNDCTDNQVHKLDKNLIPLLDLWRKYEKEMKNEL